MPNTIANDTVNEDVTVNMFAHYCNNQEYFDKMVACKCCDRHQVNKPAFLDAEWVDAPPTTIQKNFYPGECKCDCRQTLRFMCRRLDSNCLQNKYKIQKK